MHQDLKTQIWKLRDSYRGETLRESTTGILRYLHQNEIDITAEVMDQILGNGRQQEYIQGNIARFMVSLIPKTNNPKVLDPSGYVGTLPQIVQEKLHPSKHDIFTQNRDVHNVLTELDHRYSKSVYWLNPVEKLIESEEKYDLVIAAPPPNYRRMDSRQKSVSVDGTEINLKNMTEDEKIVLLSMLRLNENGKGVALVTPKFTFARSKTLDTLKKFGLFVNGVIDFPSGTFKSTNLPFNLLLISRINTTKRFVAGYQSDQKHQEKVVNNYFNQQDGSFVSQGQWVIPESFYGIYAHQALDKVFNLSKRMNLKQIRFGDMVEKVVTTRTWKNFQRLPEVENSVFLPIMGKTAATTTQEFLPERLKSYIQLIIKPEYAEASYIAETMNTDLGHAIRDSCRLDNTTHQRINSERLMEGPFFLPTIEEQKGILDLQSRLRAVQSEVYSIEQQLWKRPLSVNDLNSALEEINQKDGISRWVDTLPFPLASALWRFHASEDTHKAKCEQLFLFFHVLAEFTSIIHLSAITLYESEWDEVSKKISQTSNNNYLTIDVASLGLWNTFTGIMSSHVRRLLEKNPSYVKEMYNGLDIQLIESISSKKIANAIDQATTYRNQIHGHVGALPDESYHQYRFRLEELLSSVMSELNSAWGNSELLLPGSSTFSNDSFQYDANRVMGTRVPFEKITLNLSEPMHDKDLHLYTSGETRVLRILPLVKIMPAPRTSQNACYFYDRKKPDGLRFLSYHYEEDSDITMEFKDTADIIDNLFPNPSN